jgi:peptidoglycan hydrolase CwlO-like protein
MTLALLLRFWWAPVIAACLALAAVQTLRLDSAKASLHASRLETRAEKARARAWEASYHKSEENRRTEQKTATAATTEAAAFCDARVNAARKSANAIQTIVKTETRYDTTGCPVRSSVPVNSLRDALKPAG